MNNKKEPNSIKNFIEGIYDAEISRAQGKAPQVAGRDKDSLLRKVADVQKVMDYYGVNVILVLPKVMEWPIESPKTKPNGKS